ncbi:MAG: hypothetical protein KKH28_13785 [Elusimicrobia bacterium]|nr:hypothetical protein [Elusimicrobiota bacterium]
MKKLAVAIIAAAALASSLRAEINFDNPKFNLADEISAMELSLPGPVAVNETDDSKARPDKEWTIMVFVNAKNNLERFGLLDMNEMEMIGSSDKVNVVVELGRIAGYDSSDGDWKTSRRYLVKKDNDFNKITSPVVEDLGKVDMGDYKHLIEFGNWAKAAYPAKKYALILWNHGSGWDKARAIDKGISYDDETGNHMTTPQLGLALKGMGGVNVYGSDACLMQMPEVDYEIKDYVEYIVGSEETEPGDGYTYNLMLGPIIKNPTMSPEQLGKVTVDGYSDHYQSIGQESTQSLLKTAALPGYLAAVNGFVAAAMATDEKALVKTAVSRAQSFAVYSNKDQWHFLSLYAASSTSAAVKAKAQALQDYLTGSLIVHNRTNYCDNAKGLAIYMPGYSFNTDYNELAWAKASQWDEFIKWYIK